jgi:hypothetical protein
MMKIGIKGRGGRGSAAEIRRRPMVLGAEAAWPGSASRAGRKRASGAAAAGAGSSSKATLSVTARSCAETKRARATGHASRGKDSLARARCGVVVSLKDERSWAGPSDGRDGKKFSKYASQQDSIVGFEVRSLTCRCGT